MNTLLSLAIIKTNWEHQHKDYIENFVPLISNLIIKKKYEEIDPEKLQQDFRQEYGLIIPIPPLQIIITKLYKKQLLKQESYKLKPNWSKLQESDFSQETLILQRKFEKVLKELSNFIITNYKYEYSNEDLEQGFIAFLKQHDLDILFASGYDTFLPDVHVEQKLKYFISSFIINVNKSEPELFSFILDLSMGYSLSSAILYGYDLTSVGKLKGVNFYFDTPIILSLLGFAGEYRKKASEELINILNKEKANLFILSVTQNEVTSILHDCATRLEKHNYDLDKASPSLRCCIENEITSMEVVQIINDFSNKLKQYNIEWNVIPFSKKNIQYQIDENKLFDIIVGIYEENSNFSIEDNRKEETIRRDVGALGGIYRLREGVQPTSLKNSKAIFVTTNKSLAFASKEFERQVFDTTYFLPACITDVFLGTLVWLTSSIQLENETFNTRKLMVDCFAAMQPSKALIQKYINEVEKLKNKNTISEDDYLVLKTHPTVQSLLESKTFGEADLITDSTPKEILAEIESNIKKKEAEKLRQEQSQHQETKGELSQEKSKTNNLEEKIKNIENRSMQIATVLAYLSIIFIATCIIVTGYILSPLFEKASKFILIIAYIISISFSTLSIWNGWHLFKLKDKIARFFYNKIKQFFIE